MGFVIRGFRDIGFITLGVRYTGVRSTGDLLDIGVPYIKAGFAGYRYIGARSTGISLYFVLGFWLYRGSLNRNLVIQQYCQLS